MVIELENLENKQPANGKPTSIPVELYPPVSNLKASAEFILKGLGMTPEDADEYLLSLIDGLILKCTLLVEPRAVFVVYDSVTYNRGRQSIVISGVTFHTDRIVFQSLKKSAAIVIFAATCGLKIETLARQLMNDGYALEGLIVDLIGSELAEAIVEHLHQYVEQWAKELGDKVSNRYSPGYCNWPVSEQQQLFSLLNGNNCGIVLNENSLMTPIKSVSGIIGIGPNLKKAAYQCKVCEDLNCIMRK